MNKGYVWDGLSVLVVDDDKAACEELSLIYKKLGFAICGVANNGLEALRLYDEKTPDLVSLDIVMPVMHGIECYRELKKKNPDLKAIFISCLGGNELRESMKDELFEDLILAKPASEGALIVSLKRAFGAVEDSKSQDIEEKVDS